MTPLNKTSHTWDLGANSKHSIWYSSTTDTRGRTLVEFLSLHGLITANEKDSPTYSGLTGESWIDITVTTINSALTVQNWTVSEECTQSDHNLILFDLRMQSNNKNLRRTDGDFTRKFATQVGNWNLFQLKVKNVANNGGTG